jgi:hypothetical protein
VKAAEDTFFFFFFQNAIDQLDAINRRVYTAKDKNTRNLPIGRVAKMLGQESTPPAVEMSKANGEFHDQADAKLIVIKGLF